MKYSELKVWQKAIDVVVDVYALGYVDERREKTILSATAEIGRMMSGLKDSLGQKRRIAA